MKANVTAKMYESYKLGLAALVDEEDVFAYQKTVDDRNMFYDMLVHPRSNDKTNAADLAILTFVLLDEAYFKLLVSDTESTPLSDQDHDLMYALSKARSIVKDAAKDCTEEGKFWGLVSTVEKTLDC